MFNIGDQVVIKREHFSFVKKLYPEIEEDDIYTVSRGRERFKEIYLNRIPTSKLILWMDRLGPVGTIIEKKDTKLIGKPYITGLASNLSNGTEIHASVYNDDGHVTVTVAFDSESIYSRKDIDQLIVFFQELRDNI